MDLNIVSKSKSVFSRAKHEAAERVLSQSLKVLANSSDKNYLRLAQAFGRLADSKQQKMVADWMQDYLAPGSPGVEYFNRLVKSTHPNVRKNYIAKTIVGLFFRDPKVSVKLMEEAGINSPNLIVISPSMRCNISCVGCYAGNYTKKDDLDPAIVDRVITEAKEIGIRFFVITGGEPFFYKPLLGLFEKHNDVSFQVYTNGTLIDEALADRIVELGNVAPAISIEGFQKETDERRGPGTFDKVMRAMDNLRERGAVFAFSTTASRKNLNTIISDEFVEMLIDKGCAYGWYFSYIPIGKSPDLSYMPTPKDRNKLREGVNRIRKELPILVADFWNDGTLTGGCLAAGRKYLHINNRGDVEPCVFVHFATDNIKEVSLLDALRSPFFQSIRNKQPFGHNLLRPCPIIDHPDILRNSVKNYGAHATHDGAETVLTDLREGLDEYAENLEGITEEVWDTQYSWANDWLDDEQKAAAAKADREAAAKNASPEGSRQEKASA
ncbi:MAG: radical SAM protein [Actinobacteria bacterium]|nr:radical SAM protein [Actinomycetota bacterium]